MLGINKSKKKDQDSEFLAKENERKLSLRQNIENNVSIHVFPKKYNVSTPSKNGSQTKTVGMLIIGLGIIFLIGLIYGGYVFLIKPQTITQTPKSDTNTEVKTEQVVETPQAKETPQEIEVKKEDDVVKNIDKVIEEKVATTTESDIVEEDEVFILAVDSDGDGLSDKEESLLGSNPSLYDTDSDGYDDGSEVVNFYNPAGAGILNDSLAINKYESSILGYSLLYPADWTTRTMGENGSVVLSVGDGSFVNIIVEDNASKQDIKTWVSNLLSEDNIDTDSLIVGDTWQGIFHKNQNVFYLTDNGLENIFVFDYAPVQDNLLEYQSIFKMMINSFAINN